MSEKSQLSQTSPQFSLLEYSLQLSLHSSTARITAAYALSNPHLTIQFERKCKLQGLNAEEEIIRRGFQFSNVSGNLQGMKFSVGSFEPKSKGLKERSVNVADGTIAGSRSIRKVLLCQLGVGRAFVTDEKTCSTQPIPEGYDSYYVPKAGKDGNSDYKHDYYILSSAQILPQYLVLYDYDPANEERSRQKACCDNCENATASLYCQADHANLCKECDTVLHSANKLTSRHIRTPIGKGADVFGFCRNHPDKQIEFFCSQCHLPVCVYCKMVGHHSSGDTAKHKLVSVSEAYQSVVAESQQSDSILQSRLAAIHNQMSAIDSRAKAVEKHAAQVEAQIEEVYRAALTDLRVITKKKLDVLLGDEYELKREQGEIHRLEEFLKYQQQGDATHFLFSWARHQNLRGELHAFKHFRDTIDVQLDMKCTGTINVTVDDTILAAPTPRSPVKNGSNSSIGGGQYINHHLTRSIGPNSPSKLMMNSVRGPSSGMVGAIGGRKTQRRTSDFFTETLGALEDISFAQDANHHHEVATAADYSDDSAGYESED